MTAVGVVLAAAAGAFEALAFALTGAAPYVPALAALAGVVWALVLVLRPRTPVHGLFLFLALSGAGASAVRGQTLLGLVACTTSLFAWDLATMHRLFVQLPPRSRRGAVSRYIVHALATAAVALGIPAAAFIARPRLGFPAVLGLALAAIVSLAVALWQIGRTFHMPRDDVDAAPGSDDTPEDQDAGAAAS